MSRHLRPEWAQIGNLRFTITYDFPFTPELLEEQDLGDTDVFNLKIRIPEVAEPIVRSILLHELLHACYAAGGDLIGDLPHRDGTQREESAIRALQEPLLALLRDNPHVATYLLHEDDG